MCLRRSFPRSRPKAQQPAIKLRELNERASVPPLLSPMSACSESESRVLFDNLGTVLECPLNNCVKRLRVLVCYTKTVDLSLKP